MRVFHNPSDAEVKRRRQEEYLRCWPIEQQLEALSEALDGRPQKVDQMTADFAAIRQAFPYSKKDGESE